MRRISRGSSRELRFEQRDEGSEILTPIIDLAKRVGPSEIMLGSREEIESQVRPVGYREHFDLTDPPSRVAYRRQIVRTVDGILADAREAIHKRPTPYAFICSPSRPSPIGVESDRVDERSQRMASRFEVPILVAAALVIPVIVIEESNVSDTWKTIGDVANWIIWLVFAAEVVAMLWVVPSRWRWVRENPLDVAIVLFTPPFLPASLQALRVFRLLRLARLFRLAPLARRLFSLEGLRYVALLAALTVLGGGAAYAAVEKQTSTWDGVWWAITTMTTVGYGDLSPKTTLGRIIGIVVMLVGIGLVAIVTGAVAQRFLAGEIGEVAEATEEIEATDAELLAELRAVRLRLDRLESRLARPISGE